MPKPINLTKDGLKKVEDELNYLKGEKRKEVAEKIKVALSFGDLSENSEYDEAKNDQARVESRIMELEHILNNATVIDESHISHDIVSLGSEIIVLDEEFNEEIRYKVVGSTEADPKAGRISDESPIGKALLGKNVGDQVIVAAPAGELSFKIVKIL